MENIELVRIDDRMLHGQVVSTWLKDYNIEQVLIINDKAANDPIQKSVAGLAAPKEVKVHLFGVDQFIDILKKTPIKRKTMLISISRPTRQSWHSYITPQAFHPIA